MATTSRMWRALCTAIGRPDLIQDPRFEKGRQRHKNREVLFEEIATWTRQRGKAEAMQQLAEAGVPSSAVLDTRDLFEDPHLRARGFVETVDHAALGPIPLMGCPARLSRSAVPLRAAPLLGEHTVEVLAEDLDLSQEEIRALRDQGAIAE